MKRIVALFFLLFSLSAFALEYSVMIDAGSTGSRVFIYQIDAGKIELRKDFKVEPGLSSFSKSLKGLPSYLDRLTQFVKKEIGSSVDLMSVPLRFEATGGMRALSPKSRKRLIARVRQLLSKSDFKPVVVEVISGETEGIYQWKALNYLLGQENKSEQTHFGLVELGGASSQLTFLNPGQKLFSASYGSFGETSVWNRIGMKSCRLVPLNYTQCRKSLTKALPVLSHPPVMGELYLVETFHELTELLKVSKISSELMDIRGAEICSKSLRDLEQLLPERPEKYRSRVCYQAAYVSVVLEKMGFPRDFELLVAREEIADRISWTLGSVVSNRH